MIQSVSKTYQAHTSTDGIALSLHLISTDIVIQNVLISTRAYEKEPENLRTRQRFQHGHLTVLGFKNSCNVMRKLKKNICILLLLLRWQA